MYQLKLIGYPIEHSLSPWIHEQFLARTKLAGTYQIHEIPLSDSFSEQMVKLKRENVHGFNVTVPYKQTIIPFLDELNEDAKRMGAVNTVVNDAGKWIGYNTDGSGYVRSLENAFPHLATERDTNRILLLGAGGAARGIYDALQHAGYLSIDLANRTLEAAKHLSHSKLPESKTSVKTLAEAEKSVATYDVIIQTSSVGMKPHVENTIISLKHLKKGTIVSDIVYQPIETKFLKIAKSHGALIHHGHMMLLFQAQHAFELWTGQKVTTEGMDIALKNILEGESFVNR